VIFAWVRAHDTRWPVAVLAEVLGVSRSGYYAWARRPASSTKERQMKLTEQIQSSFDASDGTYGAVRVTRDLRGLGVTVNRKTTAKLMKNAGLTAICRTRYRCTTTDSSHDGPIASNTLDRQFTAEAPDRKWVSDFTYIHTRQGLLFLAVVIDLFSRKVVGWSMQEHMRTELVADALSMALETRRPGKGLLHHSDRGTQYASADYRQLLAAHGAESSMSRTGNCYDNAVAESFFGTLKTERVYRRDYATIEQARSSVFAWIETFYNRRRLHSSLDYMSPEAFEAKIN
jgi:transposase InsO family protein